MHSFSPFPYLETLRFYLQPLSMQDENEIFFLRSNKENNKYLDRPIAQTIEDARQFIRKIENSIRESKSIFWAIRQKGQAPLIGTICLWNIAEDNSTADIGYELLPLFQGQGVMQEVIPMVIAYGFEKIGLLSIEAELSPRNVKSLKLLEKCNFQPRSVDSNNADSVIYHLDK
jgi:ribosomal-protein-alanine N-acetyltransferase